MSAFVAALMVLTATLQVTASACKPQNRTIAICYGAQGKSVIIHLNIVTKDTDMHMKTDDKQILKYRDGTLRHGNRSWSFYNGTLRLDSALKNDSGEYIVEVHGKDGKLLWSGKIKLVIQATLSKPALSWICLPHGEVRVSCFSEGDVIEYNWTLGGKHLDRGMAYLKQELDTVILKKNASGDLTCSVRNHFSHNFTTIRLPACPAAGGSEAISCNKTSLPTGPENGECMNQHKEREIYVGITIVIIAFFFLLLVSALSASVFCLKGTRKGPGVSGEGDDNTQELLYSEIMGFTRVQEERGRVEQQNPTTIYKQIEGLKTPDLTEGGAHIQEDVVYARLKKKTPKKQKDSSQ